MVLIRSRKFLCCLPVRYGVLILAIMSILGGGALAAFGFLIGITQTLRGAPPDKAVEAAFYLQGLCYTILALVSIVGIVVTILKRRRLIHLYGISLFVMLFVTIISGIFSIVVLFYTDSNVECLTAVPDSPDNDCDGSAIITGVMVAIFLLIWGVLAYACVLVPNYAEELSVQEHLNTVTSSTNAKRPVISQPTLHFHTTYNSYTPTVSEYPFADPRQSFGVSPMQQLQRTPRSPLPRSSISHTPITHTPIVHTPSLLSNFPPIPRTLSAV